MGDWARENARLQKDTESKAAARKRIPNYALISVCHKQAQLRDHRKRMALEIGQIFPGLTAGIEDLQGIVIASIDEATFSQLLPNIFRGIQFGRFSRQRQWRYVWQYWKVRF